MSPDLDDPTVKPKTEPWGLEDLDIRQTGRDGDPDCWVITAGGGQQPGYKITRGDLESAVMELVRQVTEDAISDEAREWQNAEVRHGEKDADLD